MALAGTRTSVLRRLFIGSRNPRKRRREWLSLTGEADVTQRATEDGCFPGTHASRTGANGGANRIHVSDFHASLTQSRSCLLCHPAASAGLGNTLASAWRGAGHART